MRIQTDVYKVYQFDELSESAKDKAREWFHEGMFDYEWWDCIYDDAKRIGLKITAFDCDRAQMIHGNLTESLRTVVKRIRVEHGKKTDTYKLAMTIDLRKTDGQLEELEQEFEYALLQEYLAMLVKEVEYMESNEVVDENIRANEYEFLESGERE